MSDTWVAPGATLIGVVMGAVFSYAFTRRAQMSKSLHDSRIVAFARFAAATMEYRRALMERWFTQHGYAASASSSLGVHETRSTAWAARFEVQLLAGDSGIGELAREAVEATSAIKDAKDRSELVLRADDSRDRVEAFVSSARKDIAVGGN